MRAHPNTRVGAALRRTLDREAARLGRAWPRARKGKAEPLRQARIATRRLRQALAVVGVLLARRRVDTVARDLRAIARSFGPLRDAGMAAEFLPPYTDRADVGVVAREVCDVLDAERDDVAARAVEAVRAVPVARIRRGLDEIARSLDALPADTQWARALSTTVARRSADVVDELRRSSALYEPERLHALRIAIKKLRYAVELAAEAALVPRGMVSRLASHQKRLGAWHDRVAILENLRQRQADPVRPAPIAWSRLADLLDREAHVLYGQVRRSRTSLERTIGELRVRMAGVRLELRLRPVRASLPRAADRSSEARAPVRKSK